MYVNLKGHGHGTVYIKLWINGERKNKYVLAHTFDSDNAIEDIFFPRTSKGYDAPVDNSIVANSACRYIFKDIQFEVWCNGENDDLVIYPVSFSYRPLKTYEGSKKVASASYSGSLY
jgi:hypothetical protein